MDSQLNQNRLSSLLMEFLLLNSSIQVCYYLFVMLTWENNLDLVLSLLDPSLILMTYGLMILDIQWFTQSSISLSGHFLSSACIGDSDIYIDLWTKVLNVVPPQQKRPLFNSILKSIVVQLSLFIINTLLFLMLPLLLLYMGLVFLYFSQLLLVLSLYYSLSRKQ